MLIATQSVDATWRFGRTVLPEAAQQLHRAIMASHVRMTLTGEWGYVSSVAWSPDGMHLAVANEDNSAGVWEAETSKKLLVLSGHSRSILSVAWSPDGKRLATASLPDTCSNEVGAGSDLTIGNSGTLLRGETCEERQSCHFPMCTTMPRERERMRP